MKRTNETKQEMNNRHMDERDALRAKYPENKWDMIAGQAWFGRGKEYDNALDILSIKQTNEIIAAFGEGK